MFNSLRLRFLFCLLFFTLLTGCQGLDTGAVIPGVEAFPVQGSTTSIPTSAIPEITRVLTTDTPDAAPALPTSTVSPSLTPTPLPTPSPTPPAKTTLLFTGVIVPARCVQAAIDANGNPNYPYEEVHQIISEADLAIGTLNATISDYPPHTGCVPTYVLVGSANNADALKWAGFDAMSVATNHIKNCGLMNCGDRAFFDTLDNLKRVGIAAVGAGKNHAEAIQPIALTVNDVRFGIVSLGQIETMAFAGEDKPGIAILNEENITKGIAEARKVSDVVIAMPHWGPEDNPVPNWIQRNLARKLVEAGADIVVGNHTHVVQAIQKLDNIPIFYGLGNFVFDQDLNDHQQGVILLLNFEGKHYTGYELIPTHISPDGRVSIAGDKESEEILKRIQDASQAVEQNR